MDREKGVASWRSRSFGYFSGKSLAEIYGQKSRKSATGNEFFQ
jgi:hypothetical protein